LAEHGSTAAREALTRISKAHEFRSEELLKPTSIGVIDGGVVTTKDKISQQLSIAGVADSEYSQYFMKVAHDILDQIDAISNFSITNPYRSKLVRTIKPKQEHTQVVLSIMNYFSRVVSNKKVSGDVRVRTENQNGDLLFVVEFDPENSAVIDEIFYEYGQVVSGKMLPGDFMNSPANAFELKSKLEIAHLELRQTTELMHLARTGTAARIADLEKEVEWLRKTFETSIGRSDEMSKLVAEIAKDSSAALKHRLEIIIRRSLNGLSESDKPVIIGQLTEIAKKEPTLLKKIREVTEKSIIGAASSQLGQWITLVARSIGG
jgi:hypothetical protein